MNFARTADAIYVPVFGSESDAVALAIVDEHGDAPAVAVDQQCLSPRRASGDSNP